MIIYLFISFNDLFMSCTCDDNVLWLNVSMKNVFVVTVVYGQAYLVEVSSTIVFEKLSFGKVSQEVPHVTTPSKIENHVEEGAVLEGVVQITYLFAITNLCQHQELRVDSGQSGVS